MATKTKKKAAPKAKKAGTKTKKVAPKKATAKKAAPKKPAPKAKAKKVAPKKEAKKKEVKVERREMNATLRDTLIDAAMEFVLFTGDKKMQQRVHAVCKKNDREGFAKLHGEVSGNAGPKLYFDMSSKGLALSDKKEPVARYPFFWNMAKCFKMARAVYSNVKKVA